VQGASLNLLLVQVGVREYEALNAEKMRMWVEEKRRQVLEVIERLKRTKGRGARMREILEIIEGLK
jgi:hypothetical protein